MRISFSIKIINLAEEKGKLIHQYGVNSFRLYNLPLPKPGAVVGLIGANGIGKTTALQLLSERMKPNLGDYARERGWREVIEAFKGQEIQNYFEKLSGGGVKVSLKPQAIDRIPARLFFLLLAPTVTQHLAILGRLSRLLRDPKLRRNLLAADKPEQVIALIRDAEAKM